MVALISKDYLSGDNEGSCGIRTIYYDHDAVTRCAKKCEVHPKKELNIAINTWPWLIIILGIK